MHCQPSFDSSCNIQISELDLLLSRAGTGELFPLVGAVQIFPDSSHLSWDLEATVLLSYNLQKIKKIKNANTSVLISERFVVLLRTLNILTAVSTMCQPSGCAV